MPTTRSRRKGKRSPSDPSTPPENGRRRVAPDPSTPPRHACPFLDLPRELRDKIYEYTPIVGEILVLPLFQEDRQKDNEVDEFSIYEFQTPGQVPIGLLKTCRQVYEESAPILYSKNTFFFSNDDRYPDAVTKCNTFFGSLSPKVMKWIKSVKIKARLGRRENWVFNPFWIERIFSVGLRNPMVRFRRIMAECLPALEHVSIMATGWPDDPRSSACMTMHRREPAKWLCPSVIGILLMLPKLERFSMEIRTSEDWHEYPSNGQGNLSNRGMRPCTPVACISLIRSRVLRNGDRLGTSNIVVHKRHHAQYVYPPGQPDTAVVRTFLGGLCMKRVYVSRCDDDETGRSFLKPAERPSPLWTHKDYWKDLLEPEFDLGQLRRGFVFARDKMHVRKPGIEDPDYAECDGGDNDSLKELDLSDQNLEPATLPDEVISAMEERLVTN